jgi:hypothetical protein
LCTGIENGNADAAEQAVLKLIARAESDLANAVAALPGAGGTTAQQ